MGSKKGDLSDESKSREVYDNINSMSDVFEDGSSSLNYAKFLFNCLRNIKRLVNELYTMDEDTKNSQIQIQSVTNL